jgi:hypothetical protein
MHALLAPKQGGFLKNKADRLAFAPKKGKPFQPEAVSHQTAAFMTFHQQ